jgi:UDP-N-acetyl-D-glucosamine dehydrogenase
MASPLSHKRSRTGVHDSAARPRSSITGGIAVVGLGYVGLPLALRADLRGMPVIGIDSDARHIEELRSRHAPAFLDEEDRGRVLSHGMDVAVDAAAVRNAEAAIICVPTPVSEDHMPDLRPLIAACAAVGTHLRPGTLVVVESTVNPGICDELVIPLLEKRSGLKVEKDFYFAYCPERINPGDERWNVNTIPRVLGGAGAESTRRAYLLYRSLIDAPVRLMANVKEAEAVKIMENSFRDINIAFVNELAMSFKKLDIDITHVIEGAATKPFGFMAHYPGCGVGGHCIPVDPYYLIAYAKRKNGFQHRFLEMARHINNDMPHYTVTLLETSLREKGKTLAGSRIALLGLAYKRDVPDLRESPALAIEKELTLKGAVVRTFDPFVPARSSVHAIEDALHNADAAVIATDHTMFRSLSPKDFALHNVDIVIDGRNCLRKESFQGKTIAYHGIGR